MRKSFVRIASFLFPDSVVKFAYNQLTNPQTKKLRENELITLEKAEKNQLEFKEFQIQTYCWKGGDKKILLVHGWEGQAGNFSDLVDLLIKENYTVYSFDGPSHGFSSKGRTSLFEFTELVSVLIRKFAVKNLISHSFGGVATTYSLFANQDIEIEKYVMLTTPDRFSERISDVARDTGVSGKVVKKLTDKLEKELDIKVSELNVSTFVRNINVKKALIIHDRDDQVIPIERSLNVHQNWDNSQFVEVTDTGHFRILRTEGVLKIVLNFMA